MSGIVIFIIQIKELLTEMKMKKQNFETYIWKGNTEEEFFQHIEKQELKKIFKYLVTCNM